LSAPTTLDNQVRSFRRRDAVEGSLRGDRHDGHGPLTVFNRDASASTKRAFLLCQHFYPEMVSTGMHMTELATRLAEFGWRITAFCAKPSWGTGGEPDDAARRLVHRGVEVVRVRTLGQQRGSLLSRAVFAVTFVLSAGFELFRRPAKGTALVVTTNPPFLGLVGWLYSRLRKRPYLMIVYDVYPDIVIQLGVVAAGSRTAKYWEAVTRRILGDAAVVVVIGRDMADVVRRKVHRYGNARIVLIPNWSDERRVRPVPHDRNSFRRDNGLSDSFVVQYAGRFGRTHNIELLIRAAALLRDTDIVFQFIGDGSKRAHIEKLAAELGLRNVQFLPYQTMERLGEMLSAADLGVVCLESRFTGLSVPSKAYGVMASGTPILGLLDRNSEIGRVLSETGCGLALSDPTPEEIATVVRELAGDHNQRRAMAEAGRRAFLRTYTLTRAAAAYDSALASMLGEGTTNVSSVLLSDLRRASAPTVGTGNGEKRSSVGSTR
jgi:glycosyltransferase involved in cell wall biosynthesis